MCSELPAAPQPLQVLHVSEEEKDVFAFRVGLKQSVIKTETVHADMCEHDMTRTVVYRGAKLDSPTAVKVLCVSLQLFSS